MYQLRYYLTTLSLALIFLFNAALLETVGWAYTDAGGSFFTRIHPAFYILLVVALLQLVWGGRTVLRTVFSPVYLLFIVAGILILIRAILIVQSGVTGGELTAVIVTWLMPCLLVIALIGWKSEVFGQWGNALRIFFIINSLMGLGERIAGRRFIPSFLDYSNFLESRASGLLAHPLNASLLTGIMIVILITARPGRTSPLLRLPEVGLHIAAMFAFGGRSALVFTTAVLVLSGIIARQKRGETKLTLIQRLLPYLVILGGLLLVSMPLDFVDQTLDRFTNDTSSSETRNAAVRMLGVLDTNELLFGIDANRRQMLLDYFGSPLGIEISWIALAITYGLAVIVPLAIALPLFMYNSARQLDRSAFYAMILFLMVTLGSLSIGSKSLLVCQVLIMMVALCQKREVVRVPGGMRDLPSDMLRGLADKADSPPIRKPARTGPAEGPAGDDNDIPGFLR